MTRRVFERATVVVTGAAGGLGRSLCLRSGAAGARVAALDLDPETPPASRDFGAPSPARNLR